tara:strand:+ start:1103 stop:3181 length:2079 start_codon:yes stop_codon:yes gene_type:complete
MYKKSYGLKGWILISIIWLLSISFDHIWLTLDKGLPSWDQAEYLTNAIDHGRALGFLESGKWEGWHSLLELSPKMPPLSPIISGTFMSFSGEDSDSALRVMSLWHGLLLITIAYWGKDLGGRLLGLISASIISIAPAIIALRLNFTLDLPLAATTILSLWLLGHWRLKRVDGGGKFHQAIFTALAISSSLLIKQSALLFLAPPTIWVFLIGFREKARRVQIITSLLVILATIFPWFHQNWISIISGTNRAVIISGAKEGDPGPLDPESFIWYPRLLLDQFSNIPFIGGIAGLLLIGWKKRNQIICFHDLNRKTNNPSNSWLWLIWCLISGWFFISLSPNKDGRYIAPILPLISIILAQGWITIAESINKKNWNFLQSTVFFIGFIMSEISIKKELFSTIKIAPSSPAQEVIFSLKEIVGNDPTTLFLTASTPELNENTLTYLGHLNGGNISSRRLGRKSGNEELALKSTQYWLLATGDQGTTRDSAKALSRLVRQDKRFMMIRNWSWSKNRKIELWERKDSANKTISFDESFINLAKSLETGPKGIINTFDLIEKWHLLDPLFSYQSRVINRSKNILEINKYDKKSLWSLALISILQNKPHEANIWFEKLEELYGKGSWASVYRSFVLFADWNTCKTARVADVPDLNKIDNIELTLLEAFRDLGRSLCFDIRGPVGVRKSLPKAIKKINNYL